MKTDFQNMIQKIIKKTTLIIFSISLLGIILHSTNINKNISYAVQVIVEPPKVNVKHYVDINTPYFSTKNFSVPYFSISDIQIPQAPRFTIPDISTYVPDNNFFISRPNNYQF